MDLHISELTSEVEVGDRPGSLSPDQVERIVELVIARLEQRDRQRQLKAESMAIRPGLLPQLPWE
jgi:predicted DNA-binding protein with PD1-like motif